MRVNNVLRRQALLLRLSFPAPVPCRKFSSDKYDKLKANFKWNLPPKFNFAQDVIDRMGRDPDSASRLAFHYVHGQAKAEAKWTYQELQELSMRCGSTLEHFRGPGQGAPKRTLLILPKIPEWWLISVAAMRTGTILYPGTTMLTAEDINRRLTKADVDSVICDAENALKVENALQMEDRPKLQKSKILILTNPDSVSNDERSLLDKFGWLPYEELLKEHENKECPTQCTDAEKALIQVFFTSGTTGEPKMVPHTQASYGYCHWVTGKYWLQLTPESLHWNIAQPGWAKTAWSSVFAPWMMGAAVFVHGMKNFEAKAVLGTLSMYPITTLCAPPTLYRALVQEDMSAASSNSLCHCVSAGEPLNDEVIHAWEAQTGLLIKEGYGQTETTLLAGMFKDFPVRPGSMGKAAPGYDLRIVDSAGQEVTRGEQGNIGIRCRPERPPGLFTGYVEDPKLNNAAFVGDYYLTGDRASMDEDGYIWFNAREDDIIISAGYRIGPFEVESALLEHPAVAESAVVASPDAQRGQVVKAFVVLAADYKEASEDKDTSEDLVKELQSFVKKKTAPYKYPRRIQFVDNLPKTITGKIKRAILRKSEKKLISGQ